MNTRTITPIEAQNFDHARLIALKRAGYAVNVDVALATDENDERIPLTSDDRRLFGRIVRTHINPDRTYRIKVAVR